MPADNQTTNIQISFPPLPEGWAGTPQALLQFIQDNASFTSTGDLLTGQIGGSRPTTNVGLWVNGVYIEAFVQGKGYQPLLTVPIGAVLDWPSALNAPPDNYLFAEGQLLLITDYQALADVYGRTYVKVADDTNHFRVPDYRGRIGVGASATAGQFDPLSATGDGAMTIRTPGTYFGYEWPSFKVNAPLNAHTPRYSMTIKGSSPKYEQNTTTFNGVQNPSVGVRKIIRAK